MRRREFIVALGGATLAGAGAATAQQPATPVIGFLGAASASGFGPQLEGFRKGLAEGGFSEGRNVTIEYRWADNQNDRLAALAAELVGRRINMMLASGPPAAVAAKSATTTTPVVFVVGTDPIGAGLVQSLNRPGGNLTGMHLYIGGLVAKKLELLHELAPDVSSIAALVNPGTPSEKLDTVEIETIGRSWKASSVSVIKVGTDAEIDSVFADLAERKAAVVIGTDTFYFAHRNHIADVAAQKRVPAIHYAREFVTAGGLMSYGTNIPEIYRQAGVYAARVLKGEQTAEMPVQQPTKFELVVNLKAATALGLTVPPALLSRADEVIE
jgi:putative tryptophan/tyrosine transport system substrate-binding protein